jgi:hypothetical protein
LCSFCFVFCSDAAPVPDESTEASKLSDMRKDRWGFLVSDEFHRNVVIPEEVQKQRIAKEIERTAKWVKMIKNWAKYGRGGRKFDKLSRRVRKGVPDAVRSFVWFETCGARDVMGRFPDLSALKVNEVPERVIDEVRFTNIMLSYIICLVFISFLLSPLTS